MRAGHRARSNSPCYVVRSLAVVWVLVILAAVVLLHAASITVAAAPVAPLVATLVQPNGITISARPFGDEWANGYETMDGYTIVLAQTTGFWHYAMQDAAGLLVPSKLRAGIDQPMGMRKHLRDTRPIARERFNWSVAKRGAASQLAHTGTQKALVILVQFPDRSSVGTTPAQWSDAFFGASDSLSDYYQEISYDQLMIAPASESHGAANDGIVGWLTLPYNHPDTRGDVGNVNRQLTRDGIMAADPFVNYASYDTNGDGYISSIELHLTIIVAGYETAYGGSQYACTPSVWGHRWALGFSYAGTTIAAPVVDGKVVGHYSVAGYSQFGEQHCNSGDAPGHMATIGIMVHEMGHDLGWPDLYDTDYSSEGVGVWSVMSAGSWLYTSGYAGSKPSHPDAWCKWYQGWLTPSRVTSTDLGFLVPAVEANQFVVQLLNNPGGVEMGGTGEYFLVENRQQTGYDAGLPGCGLLIWHIDETRTSNDTDGRRLVDLEEADGLRHLDFCINDGDAGDPYPGSTDNRAFNDCSNPNSRLYSGASTSVAVWNISAACSSTMSADFTVESSYPPDIDVTPDSFDVTLQRGESAVRTLTISNRGGQNLDFEITESEGIATSALSESTAAGHSPAQDGRVPLVKTSYTVARPRGLATDVPWLLQYPSTGTVSPGGVVSVSITFDAAHSPPGVYTATLMLASNDPDESLLSLPVTLRVTPDQLRLYLEPSALAAYQGDVFALDIMVESGTRLIDSIQLYIQFDPVFLEVVDADGNPAARIEADLTTLSTELFNRVYNNVGQIRYDASKLSSLPPGGIFRVARIPVRALDATSGVSLTFVAPTDVFYAGSSILGSTESSTVVIRSRCLVGEATLQAHASSAGYEIQVRFFAPLSPVPVYMQTAVLDANGIFTVCGMADGLYDVQVKGTHSLSAQRMAVTVPNTDGPVSFCTLLEGDANDDDHVSGIDFSVLATSYDRCSADAGFDPRADFNDDGCIRGGDFSLLATNYGLSGPMSCTAAVAPGSERHRPVPAVELASTVDLAFSPTVQVADVNDILTLDLVTIAGSQAVNNVELHIEFDPAVLIAVDISGDPVAAIEPDLTTLSVVLVNSVDNISGRIRYDAGALIGTPPTGAFRVVTVRFRKASMATATAVRYVIPSGTFYEGAPLRGTLGHAAVLAPVSTQRLNLPVVVKPVVVP